MEILTPLQRHPHKWLVAQGLYWNMGGSHLSCSSSSQHYLQGLHKVSNSLAKSICEISDRVCLHPLTNKLHLWYWLPLKHISCGNILQFVTDVVQRMGVFGKLIQCLFYPAFLLLTSLPPCVLSHCPSNYYPVAFHGICAQVSQIYSFRKLPDPDIQQKMWSTSIHPC